MINSTSNCLDLAGDGDDIDVVESVETAFAIKISNDEAESCETFGELFDVVWSKIDQSPEARPKCPSAVAFYRLRSALRKHGFEGNITPSSDLTEFFQQRGAKYIQESLAKDVGLKLPDLVFSSLSIAVLCGILALGLVSAVAIGSWLPVLFTAWLAAGLIYAHPMMLPKERSSMRDYTRACTAWNYGVLSKMCGGSRPCDVWDALALVVRESSGTGFAGAFNRETRFFR